MKNMYWHQKFLPRYVIIGFCVFMLLSLFVVEHFLSDKQQPYFQQKLDASSLTFKAFMDIRAARESLGVEINRKLDPTGMGLIGYKSSAITTDPGTLYAKRTSVNPNLAALFVQWYGDVGLQKGDTVAVAMTGSFPAADMAAVAAAQTLGLKPLIILSAGASNYGANIPKLSIVDMYRILVKDKVFDVAPIGVSLGGSRDKAYGVTPEGIGILDEAIKKSGYHFLKVTGTNDSIKRRLALYKKEAKGDPIKAYINVGGGMASIGLKKLKGSMSQIPPQSLPSGITKSLPVFLTGVNSVAVNFLKEGIPVINMRDITDTLAKQYSFPYKPSVLPLVGTGSMYISPEYNTALAAGILILDLAVLIALAWLSRKYLITYKRK